MLILSAACGIWVLHQDEGWRSHQPVIRDKVVPGNRDAVVKAATIADAPALHEQSFGGFYFGQYSEIRST